MNLFIILLTILSLLIVFFVLLILILIFNDFFKNLCIKTIPLIAKINKNEYIIFILELNRYLETKKDRKDILYYFSNYQLKFKGFYLKIPINDDDFYIDTLNILKNENFLNKICFKICFLKTKRILNELVFYKIDNKIINNIEIEKEKIIKNKIKSLFLKGNKC